MEIKVCGPGCANCTRAESIVREAAAAAGADAAIEKITDFAAMAKLGVLSTPAVVIDGRVMCAGRVPTEKEVQEWLK
jgi:small redox-active disulfide protein 2